MPFLRQKRIKNRNLPLYFCLLNPQQFGPDFYDIIAVSYQRY